MELLLQPMNGPDVSMFFVEGARKAHLEGIDEGSPQALRAGPRKEVTAWIAPEVDLQ